MKQHLPRLIASIVRYQNYKLVRAYRSLGLETRNSLIPEIISSFRAHSLNLGPSELSSKYIGSAYPQVDLVIRQKIAARSSAYVKSIVRCLGSSSNLLSIPCPEDYYPVFESYGFNINKRQSRFLWTYAVFVEFLKGCFLISKTLLYALLNKGWCCVNPSTNAHFLGLTSANLSPANTDKYLFTLDSWFFDSGFKSDNIFTMSHEVRGGVSHSVFPVYYQPIPFSPLCCKAQYLQFLSWSLGAFLYALIGLFSSSYRPFLFPDAVLAAHARLLSASQFFPQYFFSNSYSFRPLWTYEAHLKGVDIIYYYYSTNNKMPQSIKDSGISFFGPCNLMNWPTYYVWDEWQARHVRSFSPKSELKVVGPIWYSDADVSFPEAKSRFVISVFDVQPFRTSKYLSLAMPWEHYVPRIVNRFLDDVLSLSWLYEVEIYFKAKRNIGQLAHPAYRAFLQKINADYKNVNIVDSSISAYRLIEKSSLVVSIPFTSTAQIGKSMGKPSVYYDASRELHPSDPAAHGIPVLQSRVQLVNLVASLM